MSRELEWQLNVMREGSKTMRAASNGGFMHPRIDPAPIPTPDPAPTPDPLPPAPIPTPVNTDTIASAITAFLRSIMTATGFVPSPALLLLISTGVPAAIVVLQAVREQLPAQYGMYCAVAIVALGVIESALSKAQSVAKAKIASGTAIAHAQIAAQLDKARLDHHAEIVSMIERRDR